jgi:Zn-dependent peptidase ImmA (M78 family)
MIHQGIEKFVQKLILEYDLKIPVDLEKLCSKLKIRIDYIDMMNESGSRTISMDIGMVICISSKINILDKRHTIAHELGHLLLHTKYYNKGNLGGSFETVKIDEKEADYFALCLLMPKKQFSEYIKNNKYSINHIKIIASEFLVTERIALIRCNSLNIFNKTKEYEMLLFFSFDLVNSTFLKSIEKARSVWPDIIETFFREIHKSIKNEIPDIEIWKYLGDEILLFYSIEDKNNLGRSPEIALKVKENVVRVLNDKFKEYDLNIKTTIWIAGIQNRHDYPNSKFKNDIYRNVEIKFTSGMTSARDFIGPDMDTGFRISKYSNKSKVTLSCELAFVLRNLCDETIYKHLYIVSYEELKGIWNNHSYPIIWYSSNWENVRKSFDYDEYKTNEIINRIIYHKEDALIPIDELNEIFKYLKYDVIYGNLLNEIKSILS